MDLWIRSQNKKCLIRASMFNLDNDETGIYCYSNEENFCLLGKYKTKERALEVLDEIQRLISLDLLNENISYQEADIYLKTAMLDRMARIYEMPKE